MFLREQQFMDRALDLAKQAYNNGEVPVGAVLVRGGQIIFENRNRMQSYKAPLAHAELLLLQDAHKNLEIRYLLDCSLYVTLEPCSMCATAIALSRVKALYFGAYDPKRGGVEHGCRIFDAKSAFFKPKIVVAGLREQTSTQLLHRFFSFKR